MMSKLIFYRTQRLVLRQWSAVRIQCAWRGRVARVLKDIAERLRYTALLKRLRNRKDLFGRLVANPHVESQSGCIRHRSWNSLALRAAMSFVDNASKMESIRLDVNLASLCQDANSARRLRASEKIGTVCRGHLARRYVKKKWQWVHRYAAAGCSVAVVKLQMAWRCSMARKILHYHKTAKNSENEGRASNFTGIIFLHNEMDIGLRCVRQSDNNQLLVLPRRFANLEARKQFENTDVWKIYSKETNALLRVVIFDGSSWVRKVHVYCSNKGKSGTFYKKFDCKVGQSAASINQMIKKQLNSCRTATQNVDPPRFGIEFVYPSLEQPPCVWVIDSTEHIRWISWVTNLGVSLGTVTVSLCKELFTNPRNQSRLKHSFTT